MHTPKSRSRGMTRRGLLAASAAVPLVTILRYPASAAEFEYKLATGQDPTHPVNTRAQEALNRIREATSDSVWQAMDGELGAYVRAQIAKTPIITVSRAWDNGFRHITSSTREITVFTLSCIATAARYGSDPMPE